MGRSKAGKGRKFQELNLSNGFLFGEVMEDEETCKVLVEIVFGREVSRVRRLTKERQMDADSIHKGVRLDVYFEDDRDTVYCVEMQNQSQGYLSRRSRHYQSVIDVKMLPVGEADYRALRDGAVVFICTFDPFGYRRFCYTFENKCMEVPELAMGDGTRKIFLSTEGENEEETRVELVDFLRYVKDSVRVEPKTDLVKKVAERVRNVKRDQSMEARYMMSLVHDNEVRMEGRKEGRQEGEEIKLIELVVRKWDKGMPVGEMVEFLEEPAEKIQRIVDVMERTGKREPLEVYGFLLSDNETEELESPGSPK